MGFCYMLQYMDKVSLSASTQLGIIKDLVSKKEVQWLILLMVLAEARRNRL